MKTPNSHHHFGLEELDAFHAESLDDNAKLHLETCSFCQELIEEDFALIRSIEQLPSFAPRAGFADRVMTRVNAEREPVPIFSFPKLSAGGRRWAAGLAALFVLSVGWAFANQGLLNEWLMVAVQEASQVGEEVGARGLGFLSAQLEVVRIDWRSPLGFLVLTVAAIGYGSAFLAFRRLVFSPNDSVGRGRP